MQKCGRNKKGPQWGQSSENQSFWLNIKKHILTEIAAYLLIHSKESCFFSEMLLLLFLWICS